MAKLPKLRFTTPLLIILKKTRLQVWEMMMYLITNLNASYFNQLKKHQVLFATFKNPRFTIASHMTY